MLAQPPILYGTAWKGARTTSLVVQAVLQGFRGIDTACQPKHYRQELVGDALEVLRRDHGIEREQLFVQTKFTSLDGQDMSKPLPYDRNAPLDQQLKATYIDSLVMHSPMRTRAQTMAVWKEFEKLVESGQVKQIGLSNIYDPDLLQWAFESFDVKPSVIQNRFCAEHRQFCKPILELCQQHGARFQSFWTLSANLDVLSSPSFLSLASSQSLTPAAACYKFLIQTERFGAGTIVPLNGTTSLAHMKEDLEVLHLVEREKQQPELSSKWEDSAKEVEQLLWG